MAPKIHCNDPEAYAGVYIVIPHGRFRARYDGHGVFQLHDLSFAAKSFCGIAGWRSGSEASDFREGTTIPIFEFRYLPAAAQCGGCGRRLAAFIDRHDPGPIGRSLYPLRAATEEMILSVEAFLHWLVRLFERDFPELEEIPLYSYCG